MLKKTTIIAVAHTLLLLATKAQAHNPIEVLYTPIHLIYAHAVRIEVAKNIYDSILAKTEIELDAKQTSGSSGNPDPCKITLRAEPSHKNSATVIINKCTPLVMNCLPTDWQYAVTIDSNKLILNFKSIFNDSNVMQEDVPATKDESSKGWRVAQKDLMDGSMVVTNAAICSKKKGWSKLITTAPEWPIAVDQIPEDKSIYVWADLGANPMLYGRVQLKEAAKNATNQQYSAEDAEPFTDCVDPQGRQRDVICVDAYNPRTHKAKSPEVNWSRQTSSHILRPNTAVLVRVRHPEKTQVRFAMEGQRGLVTHGIQDNTRSAVRSERSKSADGVVLPSALISSHSYAPRKPGNADIRVQILDENGTALTGEELIEMTVEETYVAAFRVGLAAVGGEAVDRSYEARRGTSGMSELAVKSRSAVEPELVVGFAPFVIEAFRGGRAYSFADGFASKWLRFAPYIGVGVLTQSPNGIDGLKSFYFGLEWELAPSFSVAFTGVLRRVTRPADGLDLGSIVSEGAELTQSTHTLGWGVVVNIAPGFLRIANQTAASFFK